MNFSRAIFLVFSIYSLLLISSCNESEREKEIESISKLQATNHQKDDFEYMSLVSKEKFSMIKLYKGEGKEMEYQEAWVSDGYVTHHWGVIGEEGESKDFEVDHQYSNEVNILKVLKPAFDNGFKEKESGHWLIIEYKLTNFGNESDLKLRHELENFLNEKLGWTGLGHCDGGSIGSGTFEVACFVIEKDVSKSVLEKSLKDTEKFSKFNRIYFEE